MAGHGIVKRDQDDSLDDIENEIYCIRKKNMCFMVKKYIFFKIPEIWEIRKQLLFATG